MTTAVLEPQRWSRRRWGTIITLLFGVQVGLIFWLGERSPVQRRPLASVPALRVAGSRAAEFLALTDPALFALPHERGFSGPAWLSAPPLSYQPFTWSEAPAWLLPSLKPLAGAFASLVESNLFSSASTLLDPIPEMKLADVPALESAREHSEWRVEGDLAQRRLLTKLTLSAWPAADLLTNSVVQLLVDAQGRPVSVTLLSHCGSREADRQALQQAQAARFESVAGSGPGRIPEPLLHLTWGKLIFEWQTLPLAPTNAPAP